jgi:NAD-dependent deacetylase
MKKIVVLTGAGISAESGIKTFRDADGLWEGHDVMQVASPQGFKDNPSLVLNFYNERRKQLLSVEPNAAHNALAKLETHFDTTIITQNIDDLHERAGSSNIIHLHGELLKVRSSGYVNHKNDGTLSWKKDVKLGDICENGHQLRPHIVWFGEHVPLFEKAIEITQEADVLIIIGTSMQVYPAASLVDFIIHNIPIYFIDPKPSVQKNDFNNLTIIAKTAVNGVPDLVAALIASLPPLNQKTKRNK